MYKVVYEFGSTTHFVSAVLKPLQNSLELVDYSWLYRVKNKLVNDLLEVGEKVLHRAYLSNHRVEWVPELVGNCPINHLQELLFCHGIIVEHFVRDIYYLDEVLLLIIF